MISLKTSKAILSIGDVNPDIILPYGDSKECLRMIASGEKMTSSDQPRAKIYAGGAAANTASCISRLGRKTYFSGVSGKDWFASFLQEEFEKDGVDCKYYVKKEGLFTPLVIAVIGEDKERVLYVWPTEQAALHQIYPDDIPRRIFDEIGWVHTSGISLREDPSASTIMSFIEACKKRGIIVSFDLNLRTEEVGLQGDYADNIKRAVESANVIFGSGVEELCPLTGKGSPQAAARSLVRSDRMVVSRAGEHGVAIYTDEEEFEMPAYKVDVVDTIGAGDASNAGFIVAASEGMPMTDSARWSNAVAGYVLGFVGARSGPNQDQLKKFMRDQQ